MVSVVLHSSSVVLAVSHEPVADVDPLEAAGTEV